MIGDLRRVRGEDRAVDAARIEHALQRVERVFAERVGEFVLDRAAAHAAEEHHQLRQRHRLPPVQSTRSSRRLEIRFSSVLVSESERPDRRGAALAQRPGTGVERGARRRDVVD